MAVAKRVLVVEDDPSLQRLVAAVLRRSGLTPDCAGDGVEALEKLAGADFDLLLLDLMMPRMDGIRFLEALARQGEAARYHGPIIVMTAAADALIDQIDGTRVQAIVRKPFDIAQLASLVARALERQD